ncbi:MAG TPA: hypothetical protein VFS54_04190 [Solirubrobacterales bacterium]|nr:hypothetical protein [Solirubrobacterales bacterium]
MAAALLDCRGLEFSTAENHELVGTSAEIAGGILERRLGNWAGRRS